MLNFIPSFMFILYGLILSKFNVKKLSLPELTADQKDFFFKINFVDIRFVWSTQIGKKLSLAGILYFFSSEAFCAAFAVIATKLNKDLYRSCVMTIRADIILCCIAVILFFLVLGFISKQKKRIAEQHEQNFDNAIKAFNERYTYDDEE